MALSSHTGNSAPVAPSLKDRGDLEQLMEEEVSQLRFQLISKHSRLNLLIWVMKQPEDRSMEVEKMESFSVCWVFYCGNSYHRHLRHLSLIPAGTLALWIKCSAQLLYFHLKPKKERKKKQTKEKWIWNSHTAIPDFVDFSLCPYYIGYNLRWWNSSSGAGC